LDFDEFREPLGRGLGLGRLVNEGGVDEAADHLLLRDERLLRVYLVNGGGEGQGGLGADQVEGLLAAEVARLAQDEHAGGHLVVARAVLELGDEELVVELALELGALVRADAVRELTGLHVAVGDDALVGLLVAVRPVLGVPGDGGLGLQEGLQGLKLILGRLLALAALADTVEQPLDLLVLGGGAVQLVLGVLVFLRGLQVGLLARGGAGGWWGSDFRYS